MTPRKPAIRNKTSPATEPKPKSNRGGPRPGSGRKPKQPGEVWRGGRPATRGDVAGRVVQAVAETVEEADHWRAKAKDSGLSMEMFFAAVLRDALGPR